MNIYLNVRLVIFVIDEHLFGNNTPETMPSQSNANIKIYWVYGMGQIYIYIVSFNLYNNQRREVW